MKLKDWGMMLISFLLSFFLLLNLLFLWGYNQLMRQAKVEEPKCVLEELVEELSQTQVKELYCKGYRIIRTKKGALIVTK